MKLTRNRMKITKENIICHELIGLPVKVTKSTHKGYLISGTVIDETKNMIIIEGNGIKKIPKNMSTFEFTSPNGVKIEVEGKEIVGRPEDRIKNVYKIKKIRKSFK